MTEPLSQIMIIKAAIHSERHLSQNILRLEY